MNSKRSFLAIFTGIFIYSTIAIAQFGQAKIGTPVPGVQPNIKRNNQSQVIWHNGYWWGAFRQISDSQWYLYRYENGVWSRGAFMGIVGADAPDLHVDYSNNRLYAIFPEKGRFTRLTYSAGSWSLDNEFPAFVPFVVGDDDASCLTQAHNGDLFVFYAKSAAIRGIHSSDGGATWSASDFVVENNVGNTLTDAIAFRYNFQDYTGVFAGEGSGAKRFMFFRLKDGDDPTNSANWVEENILSSLEADNHVNIIKDFEQNLYAIAKLGETGFGGVSFKIFRRSNASGNWSDVDIVGATIGINTRPALALDESNDELYAFSTIGGKIQFAKMDKDNPGNIAESDWQPILSYGSSEIVNVSVTYQPLSSGSGILVAAENKGTAELWYNKIELDFTTSNTVIISEVNSASVANSASFIELYNFSRSSVNLGSYRLRYYNDNATGHTGSKRLEGTIPPLGYVVLAPDAAAFQNAYGFAPDFIDTEFDLDGGADGIALERSGSRVDLFNSVGDDMIAWNAGALFQRVSYPNSGSNLPIDYAYAGTSQNGTPGDDNDIPVAKSGMEEMLVEPDRRELPQRTVATRKPLQAGPLVSVENYPNPFNPETSIRFELSEATEMYISIFDIRGNLIRQIYQGRLPQGAHRFRWDGRNENGLLTPSGLYFLRLSNGKSYKTLKLILSR